MSINKINKDFMENAVNNQSYASEEQTENVNNNENIDADSYAALYVDEIVQRLKIACTAWYKVWENDDIELLFAGALLKEFMKLNARSNSSIMDESVDKALLKLQRNKSSKAAFPPTPAAFVDLVAKFQFGTIDAPSAVDAYNELCKKGYYTKNKDWSHVAVLEAGRSHGFWDLNRKSLKDGLVTFQPIYESVLREIENGAVFIHDEPVMPVEQKEFKTTPASKKYGLSELANLRAIAKRKH